MPAPADLWSHPLANPVTGEVMPAGDMLRRMAEIVWSWPLGHPVTGDVLPAGTLLRYVPAEHEATRAVIIDAVTTAVSQVDGVDPEQVRRAVEQGVADALASIETTVTIGTGQAPK